MSYFVELHVTLGYNKMLFSLYKIDHGTDTHLL